MIAFIVDSLWKIGPPTLGLRLKVLASGLPNRTTAQRIIVLVCEIGSMSSIPELAYTNSEEMRLAITGQY